MLGIFYGSVEAREREIKNVGGCILVGNRKGEPVSRLAISALLYPYDYNQRRFHLPVFFSRHIHFLWYCYPSILTHFLARRKLKNNKYPGFTYSKRFWLQSYYNSIQLTHLSSWLNFNILHPKRIQTWLSNKRYIFFITNKFTNKSTFSGFPKAYFFKKCSWVADLFFHVPNGKMHEIWLSNNGFIHYYKYIRLQIYLIGFSWAWRSNFIVCQSTALY